LNHGGSEINYPETTSLNSKDSPDILKESNTIAVQALRVEPNARPLLMVGLVEKAANSTLVRARKKIEEAFVNDEGGSRGRCLQTAGVNFEEIWKLSENVVAHGKLSSNDVWAVRCAYGVEAARSEIMEQIRNVFGAYGIEVDPRHLSLIADYMTYDGDYKPMSQRGIEDSSSAFLQMSFETTAYFLKKAAMINSFDALESPSANIVLGRPVKHGTGLFTLLAKTASVSADDVDRAEKSC
jgi:DNA-directed RNA polymerase I subunit RPA1